MEKAEQEKQDERKKGHEFQYGRNNLSHPVWDQ